MSIKIISPGLQTTIQDLGRKEWSHMGVPESGAADKFSFKLANFLLGKGINSPVMECTLTGPSLRFLKPFFVAITGADMKPEINGKNTKMNTVIRVEKDDLLSLSGCSEGCRSYIAFSENLVANRFLDSFSTYIPAKLGGFEGLPIKAGTIISTQPSDFDITASEKIDLRSLNLFTNEWELKVFEGPEYNLLSSESKRNILKFSYTVSNDSNRMGSRLEGGRIELTNDEDMISCPMNVGTVQCPKNGLPIILGCDSQTLGGYPRILQVSEVNFPHIGQLRPFDKVLFTKTSIHEARNELWKQSQLFPF